MPESTDTNSAEEIRCLYVQTLTDAKLASETFLADDGFLSTGIRSNEQAAQVAADALAEAGLLPTGVRWSIAWREAPASVLDYGGQTQTMPPRPSIGTGSGAIE